MYTISHILCDMLVTFASFVFSIQQINNFVTVPGAGQFTGPDERVRLHSAVSSPAHCNRLADQADTQPGFCLPHHGIRLFVRYCAQGSSLLWTPVLRPLCRSNAPAQGEEGNW